LKCELFLTVDTVNTTACDTSGVPAAYSFDAAVWIYLVYTCDSICKKINCTCWTKKFSLTYTLVDPERKAYGPSLDIFWNKRFSTPHARNVCLRRESAFDLYLRPWPSTSDLENLL